MCDVLLVRANVKQSDYQFAEFTGPDALKDALAAKKEYELLEPDYQYGIVDWQAAERMAGRGRQT